MTDSETAGVIEKPGMSLGTMGMVLVLAAIASFFLSLVVAYAFILPLPGGRTAVGVKMPLVFWLSTVVLFVSSATFQWARRALRRALLVSYQTRLRLTLSLGYGFLFVQLIGAWVLHAHGVKVMGNPQGNMFYTFCAIHGVHVLGGLGGMHWLLGKAARLEDGEEQPLRKHRQAAKLTAMYWHFMGGLWVMLFGFLLGWS